MMVKVICLGCWLVQLPQYRVYWFALGVMVVHCLCLTPLESFLVDSVEPLLLSFDVALLLLEPILLEESPVSMVDKESGLLSDVPLSSATLLSAFKPVSGTLS